MAVSDALTPRKGPALGTWRGTPSRSPHGQVLGPSLGGTGLFARAAAAEAAPSPPPPQRSQVLPPPGQRASGAQLAGEHGSKQSHGGRHDSRCHSGAATSCFHLQGGAYITQPHAPGTPAASPAATAASLRTPRHSTWSSSSGGGGGGPLASPQAASRQSAGAWSPMRAGGGSCESLAAQGAGVLRVAPGGGSSAADAGWQVRRGTLPASSQVLPEQSSSRSAAAAPAAPAAETPAVVLAQLRRQLRQLDPSLGVAPSSSSLDPVSAPSTAAGARGAAPRASGPAAEPPPLPPPRLPPGEGVQAALAQLRRYQQQAQRLQAPAGPVQRPAASETAAPAQGPAVPPQRSRATAGGAERRRTPEREPSPAAGGRLATVAAQLRRLRLLQGQGAELAGFTTS